MTGQQNFLRIFIRLLFCGPIIGVCDANGTPLYQAHFREVTHLLIDNFFKNTIMRL